MHTVDHGGYFGFVKRPSCTLCSCMMPIQMAEPTCSRRFNFEYERVFGTGDIPKDELQKMMFDDMCHFATTREESVDDVADNLSKKLLISDSDEQEDDMRRK